MKINFKVRFKNPMFWIGVVVAVFSTILAQLGLSVQELTTWGALFGALVTALKNPFVIIAVVASVYNAVIDPTTYGVCDSKQALTYEEPKKE